MKLGAPPEWGIQPVPRPLRILGTFDYFALWLDLGISLLVLASGALIATGLGFGWTIVAIIVGTALGNLLLALAGLVGSDHGVPSMVGLRPSLGIRGSWLASLLNLVQLIGFGAFEIYIMAAALDGISQQLFGFGAFPLWAVLFAVLCTLMAVSGSLLIVPKVLKRYVAWLALALAAFLTGYLALNYNLGELLTRPGDGSLSFWQGVDVVVANPVSWLPLVADYSRFAQQGGRAFWGTYLGFYVSNAWFYALGALLVLAVGQNDLIVAFTTLGFGWLALLVLLIDEPDEAFADIYSAAVSVQNIIPGLRQWLVIVTIGAVCLGLALVVNAANFASSYLNFLLYIGAVFVPLFGVFAADYFIRRRRQLDVDALYRQSGSYWFLAGFNWPALVAWLAGAVVYRLVADNLSWLGSTLPSFAAAFVLYLVLAGVSDRLTTGEAAGAAR